MEQTLRKSIFIGFIFLLCQLVIWGCQTPIEQEELNGTWRLSSESRSFLSKEFSELDTVLQLEHNGTFIAQDLPQSSFFVQGEWQEFIMRGHGTWKLGTHQNRPVVHLNFQELENYTHNQQSSKDFEENSIYGFYVYIYHNPSEFYLFYYDNDPDLGREIRFRKAEKGI
jgi:hypothetical protein